MWVLTLLLWHNTNRWPIGCLQLYRLHIANAIALAAGSETQTQASQRIQKLILHF
jgi:hypothetical protein